MNKSFVGASPSRLQTGEEPSPFWDTLINRVVLKTAQLVYTEGRF